MANKPAKGAVNFGKPSSNPVAAMPKAKNSASKKK
jgi:hypothetical protein